MLVLLLMRRSLYLACCLEDTLHSADSAVLCCIRRPQQIKALCVVQ